MTLFLTAVSLALLISFLCSICEAVLLSINHAQIEILGAKHPAAGRLMAGFKRRIDAPVAAILILNTVAHTMGATVSGATYVELFGDGSLVLFSIVFTAAVLLFTEIVPKTLGVSFATVLAVPVAQLIRVFTVMLHPLVRVSEWVSRWLRGDRSPPVTSVDEIRLLASLGRSEGIVGNRTADMIVGATLLKKIRAADIMVPRRKVVFLSGRDSREETLSKLKDSEYSRFPFSPTEELDDFTGVVLSRHLLYWISEHPGQEIDWAQVTDEALVVPESTPLENLLKTFQSRQRHLAVVVDEFGSVHGIATLEDVIEEVVGEIYDESDEQPTLPFQREQEGSFVLRASTDLRRVCSMLGLAWEPEENATTIGGLVAERLGRIPLPGDSITWRGFGVEVATANSRRAETIRISANGSNEE